MDKVKYNDMIKITGYNYQHTIPIGTIIKAKIIIPQFNAVDCIDEYSASIWVLPDDYEIIKE